MRHLVDTVPSLKSVNEPLAGYGKYKCRSGINHSESTDKMDKLYLASWRKKGAISTVFYLLMVI